MNFRSEVDYLQFLKSPKFAMCKFGSGCVDTQFDVLDGEFIHVMTPLNINYVPNTAQKYAIWCS